MTRRIATWAAIAIAVFGLTACSGAPSAPESPAATTTAPAPPPAAETTPPPAAETTPPPAEEAPSAEQSLAEACLEPSAKLLEASAQLTGASAALAASDGKDAQAVVDAFKEMGDYFSTLAESATNPEVKEALTGMAKGYADFAKFYGKLLIDEDLSAAADAMEALADLQKSLGRSRRSAPPESPSPKAPRPPAAGLSPFHP
ncbi:MAG: hypothetical protein LCH76_00780 [Actinobacteria bacterium]|nr:hypothetical protein [Actinomycetota bacterium]